MKQTAGASGGGEDKKLKKNIEYILIYAKNIDSSTGFKKFNEVYEEENLFTVIENMKNDGKSWKYTRIIDGLNEREYIKDIFDGSGEIIKLFKHNKVRVRPLTEVCKTENISIEEVYVKYFDKIFRDTNAQSSIRTRVMESSSDLGEFVSIDYIPRSGKNKNKLTTVYYKGTKRDQIAWLSDIAVKKGKSIVKLEKLGTFWDGFPLNNLTKEGGVLFPNGKKPELLIKTIIDLSTDENDIVLDSFAGSGTTAAVTHKMKRKWISVELGEHAKTHCYPRLKAVVDGEQGGISKAVNWQGGGGFKFYTLAPSLLKKDKFDNFIISPDYNPDMLAAAMAKQEGFKYQPDEVKFWKQGQSSENDYIFTTTQFLTVEALEALHDDMQPGESLLICCKAFQQECRNKFTNITIKKIPKVIIDRFKLNDPEEVKKFRDDYSFSIINMPHEEENDADEEPSASVQELNDQNNNPDQPTLFD